MKVKHAARHLSFGTLLAAVAWVAACSEPGPTSPESPSILAAKGGNGGGDGPTVDATDPTSAPQGATLPVGVFGSGFDPGSVVDFLLDGKKTTKVVTNSTSFVGAGELIADITIAADAPLASYDVRVTTSRKKKGIGTELFKIVGTTFDLPISSGSDGLFSDGGGPFIDEFDPDQMALSVDCPRRFVLVRPADWPVVSGDEVHCSGRDGFSRLDLNDLGSRPCADPGGCPIGTTGHDPSSHFGPDLNYYFRVSTGPGKGNFASYNVVWTDALFTIDQTENGDPSGTACRWHVWANTAEFWERTGGTDTIVQVDEKRAMALDVIVERQDLNCP
ncbi:MAG: hypothetical protein ACE5JR_09830 [Gemmatimonadota bacterium]